MEGEIKEGRKIQFSVPTAGPMQLDPRQVEMIRRRRPTPATLFHVTDHPSPEDEAPSLPSFVGENGVSKPKNTETAIYKPPSLQAVQKMAQAHIKYPATPSSESSDNEEVSFNALNDPADKIKSEKSECPSSSSSSSSSSLGGRTEKKKEQEAGHLRVEIEETMENQGKGEE